MLLAPSLEQEDIVRCITDGKNVICDAVAGAGKTTTVLWIAKENPSKHVVQITYNSQLKEEVRCKAKPFSNLEIHTYHSLAVNYYDRNAHTDASLRRVVTENKPPSNKFKRPRADILVIDEAQDMTLLFFHLLQKYVADINNPDLTFLIMGDRNQSIYEFKSADSRFLTMAEEIWKLPMMRKRLGRSYRLTDSVGWFVNRILMDEPCILTDKKGPAVQYIRDNAYDNVPGILISEIVYMLKSNLIEPGDIFVLSGSVKNGAPFKKLENAFVANGIPCFVPSFDTAALNSKVIQNKAVFTTFHQAKGRERAVVIILGFDSLFFKYFARTKPRDTCPSELYVAVTRSTKYLYLVEHFNSKTPTTTYQLPFLKYDQLVTGNSCIDYVGEEPLSPEQVEPPDLNTNPHQTSPTDIVRFMNDDVIAYCTSVIDSLFTTVSSPSSSGAVQGQDDSVLIPSTVLCHSGLTEEVSDLNGLIIPAMWEATQTSPKGLTTLHSIIKAECTDVTSPFLLGHLENVKFPCVTIQDYIVLAITYHAIVNKVHFKLAQIDRFDWLTDEMVTCCRRQMEQILYTTGSSIQFECVIGCHYLLSDCYPPLTAFIKQRLGDTFGSLGIEGRLDVVTDDTLWELKCVDVLTLEHKLQLVVYAWMWRMFEQPTKGDRQCKLLNIRTGELLLLDSTNAEQIDNIMVKLLFHKFKPVILPSHDEFVANCHRPLKYENEM